MAELSHSQQFKVLREIESREKAEASLHEFVRQAWPILEGGFPLIDGWHIGAISEHLQAVIEAQIQFLIVNVPPRSSKSTIISACLCAWTWLQSPYHRFYYASHSANISTNDSLKCRRLIESDWYQQRWGDRFALVSDQNTKNKFENDKTGYRQAASTNSKTTGVGGSILVLDDPNDTNESDLERENTNTWLDQTWSSRINDRKTGAKILVQQRTHEVDASGHFIQNDKNGDCVKLILPMEFEMSRRCKTISLPSTNGKIWEDPRQVEGELLCPARWGAKELSQIKNELKTQYSIAGQLQQRPAPEEGGMIKKAHFKWWKHNRPPTLSQVIQSWDTALDEKKTNCYSACTTWGVFEDNNGIHNLLLLALHRARYEYPELREMAQRLYHDYQDNDIKNPRKPDGHHLPDIVLVEAKSTGSTLIQELNRAGICAMAFNPDKHGDKIKRVRMITHLIERGQVWVPALPPEFTRLRSFADLMVHQAGMFPNGESRDLVDSMTQVLIRLNLDGWLINPKYDSGANDTSIKAPSEGFY